MFSAADLCQILAHTHIHICTHTKHADPSRALVLSHPGPFRMEVLNIVTDSCQTLTIFSKFPSRLIPLLPLHTVFSAADLCRILAHTRTRTHTHTHTHTHTFNTQVCTHNTVTVGRVYAVATVCLYESGGEGGSPTFL